MERRQSNQTEGLSGFIAVKGRDLVKELGEDKAKIIMKKRHTAGLYYDDEDFPDDEMERNYYMKKQKEINKRVITEDGATLRGQVDCDKDAVMSLIGEDGLMKSGGFSASLGAANSAGEKALMEGLSEGAVAKGSNAKAKAAKKKEEEEAKEVKPKTLIEQAVDLMAEILAESTTARKKSMSLGAAAFSGELASQLLDFATKMEKHYKTLQTAVNEKCQNNIFYEKAFKKIQEDRQWFLTAEPAADSILSGLKRASKKDKEKKTKGRKAKGGKED